MIEVFDDIKPFIDENKPLKNKFKVIKNSTSFLDGENKNLIDNELSYLADLAYPKKMKTSWMNLLRITLRRMMMS